MSDTRTRYTAAHPCPICHGHDRMDRGCGERCYGYLWQNGEAAICTREEHAGALQVYGDTNGYLHALVGDCECGRRHDPRPPSPNGHSANGKRAVIVGTYDYRAADGTLLYQCVRTEPKGFRQRRPDGNGGWIWNLKGVERVPYRLPAVLAADPADVVVVVEGEKDADRLAGLGFVATTNAMGAGKWRDSYSEALRGRDVVIIGDNDDEGRKHVKAVAQSLQGKANSVRVVELDGLPDKGDVSDWLDAGHTAEELRERIGNATEWTAGASGSTPNGNADDEAKRAAFALTPLVDLLAEPPEEQDWAVEDLLARGGLSMLAAKPKVGKTTLARNLALQQARGGEFLGRACAKGAVVYLALEEKRSEVAKHFRRMGAENEPIYVHVGSAPDEALAALEQAIGEHKAVLAIVDPVLKLIRVQDANDYAQVSRAFEPLINLARRTGCHILTVHHMSKGERTGGDALLGSTAIFGAVDAALLMKRRDMGRTVESIQRYGVDLPETILTLDDDTGVVAAAGEAAQLELERARAAVLKAMGDEPRTEGDIKERVGGNQTVTAKALRALVDEAVVKRTGEGKKGDPYLYSKAAEVASAGQATDGGTGDADASEAENARFSRFTHSDNRANRANPETTGKSPEDVGGVELVTGQPCWTCHKNLYWIRPLEAGGGPVCAECHPPPAAERSAAS